MRRRAAHVSVVAVRVAFAAGICVALPFSHMRWGESPESGGVDGPAAFGLLLIMFVLSMIAGFAYLTVGSVAHVLLRRRLPFAAVLDVALGFAMLGLLIGGGMNATYSSATQAPLNEMEPVAK